MVAYLVGVKVALLAAMMVVDLVERKAGGSVALMALKTVAH